MQTSPPTVKAADIPGQAKPFARSYAIKKGDLHPGIKRPHGASQSYPPGAMPAAYNMPTGVEVVPQSCAILELNGRFYPGDVALWAAASGLPAPVVNLHDLPGSDHSDGNADGEVGLDWEKTAEFYSYITGLPLTIELVTAPNTEMGIPDGVTYCTALPNAAQQIGAGSLSWGQGEDQWSSSSLSATDANAKAAPFPWNAASGDNGSSDGEAGSTLDGPSCLASWTSCGGTSRVPNGGIESVWNNGNGEGTGGGFSKIVPKPSWQPTNSQGNGRMSPDLAMNADPNTGHDTIVNGVTSVIGGTSAVAPMFAGFMCAVNGRRLKLGLPKITQANPLLWQAASSFADIVSGNNGAYNATVGPDPCSGLGRPLPTLFATLTEATTVPPPTPPPVVPPVNPPPTQPPTTGLSLKDVLAIVDKVFAAAEKLESGSFLGRWVIPMLKSINQAIDSAITAAWPK